jgi:hypothetical protein
MKADGNSLLGAKVLVISRLLHKALGLKTENAPIIDGLRDKLGSLRGRLLRRIDKRLATKEGDVDSLVENMVAYSLATSSTPTDVLRHFHHVRLEQVKRYLEDKEGLKGHGINALKLCIQTCTDTQTIFPRRLAEALAKLKAQPLVQDAEVRALWELSLDVRERWIGDEARNYTPQPRHDELKRDEAEKLLGQWSKQAIGVFLKGIKTTLEGRKDLKEVAELRQDLVETWIMNGSRMAGVKSKNVLDDLRDALNAQLEGIVRGRAQRLRSVVELITDILTSWEDAKESSLSLWKATSTASELSNGAQTFKERILNTHQGRDNAVIRVIDKYDEWMDSVLEVKGIVKSMKETRWDDPFADDVDLDGSDSEDGFGDNSKQTLLSGDDPRLVEEVTQEALADALTSLGKAFAKIVQDLAEREGDDERGGMVQKAIFVLRTIREVGDRIPRLRINEKTTPPPSPFTTQALRPLHRALAAHAIQPSIDGYKKSLKGNSKSVSKSHILWEGNPALPAQPSPSAFRFLQRLENSMGGCGADLWAPEAVGALKQLAQEEVVRVWKEELDAIKEEKETVKEVSVEPAEEGEEAAVDKDAGDAEKQDVKPDAEDIRQQHLKQFSFDVLYIQRYLSTTSTPFDTDSLVKTAGDAAGVDEGMNTRLKKSAGDYARKTYLLFALLA